MAGLARVRPWVADGRVLAATLAIGNAAWVALERHGQLLDIDEAGYFSISMVDHAGWADGGLSGWWDAVQRQPVHAPLAPALASVLHIVTGPRALNIFLVNLAAYAIVMATVHLCTRRWSSAARLTAIAVVGCAPVMLHFSRSFNFSTLTSAMVMLALYGAVRSERCSRLGASCAWGAATGGMLLARTMTFAFLPAVVLAAAVPMLAHFSWRALRNFAAGCATGAAVALTWYWANADTVYEYLRGFGYGARAAEYGSGRSISSPTDWYLFAVLNANGYLQAGVTIALLVGVGATAVAVARHVAGGRGAADMARRLGRLASSGSVTAGAVWIVAPSLTAMMSSRTNGSAFIAPLVAPMAIIAARGVEAVQRPRRRTAAAIATLVLVVPAAVLSYLPIRLDVTSTAHIDLPLLPAIEFTVLDSRGTLRTYLDGGDPQHVSELQPGTAAHARAWFAANARLNDDLRNIPAPGGTHLALFSFRHRLLNPNSLMTDAHLREVPMPYMAMLNPGPAGESAADNASQSDPYLPSVSVLFTATPGPNEFEPTLPPGVGELLAERLGFVAIDTFPLPDGRVVTVWAAPPAPS